MLLIFRFNTAKNNLIILGRFKIMKVIKQIILFVFLLFCIADIIAQQKTNSQIVTKYVNTIDSINNVIVNNMGKINTKVDPVRAQLQKMNHTEIKHLASLMYKATDWDYNSIMNLAYERYYNDRQKFVNTRRDKIDLLHTPAIIQMEMKNLISPTVYALTRVAFFLRVRINDIKTVIPKEEGLIHAETSVIDATIEKVYKGAGKYKSGDHIQFYYYKFWQKEPHNFKVGEEYFVPLEPRGSYPNLDQLIALVPYLDDSNGYYPVVNGYIIDKYNYFGFGTKVPYNEFEKELEKKIEEVKSW